jgi:magnesium transporter
MQPTERVTETNPSDPRPRPGDKDLLRDALRDQADRGRSKFDIVLLSVQRLLHRGAITNLAKMLGRMHQADVAQVIMHLSSPKEKREVFELVRGESKRGQVLSELDSDSINQVLADLLHADIAWLIKDLGPDDAAYLLGVLPEERAKEILSLMRAEDSTEVADLLKYPKDTAGGIMTTEFFALPEDATAQDAIRRLQLATDAEMVFYIYVTDKDERLLGEILPRET